MSQAQRLIIGASHGIGEVLAKSWVDEGDEVTSFSRTQGVGSWNEWKVSEAFPIDKCPEVIDSFVYCPGSINLKPFHLLKPEDFLNDLHINILSAVEILQKIQPRLKKSAHASVLLFSTVAVKKGMNFHSSVAMSKGALEGLVRSLAIEWAPHIRVNAIAPSLVQTPLSEKLTSNAAIIKATIEKHPLKKIGVPQDIAQMAKFLLSQDASWVTGQVIGVDGGLSIS